MGRDLKCLFLWMQSPQRSTIENLVRHIIIIQLKILNGQQEFWDFRSKWLDGVKESIKEFKEKRIQLVTLFHFNYFNCIIKYRFNIEKECLQHVLCRMMKLECDCE